MAPLSQRSDGKQSMLKHYLTATGSAMVLLATMAGCLPQQPQSRIAVIDLERVADETGLAKQINTQLEGLRISLQGELTKAQDTLTVQLTEKQENFGEKPTDEQQQELNALFANAKQQLQTAQQEALNVLRQQRTNLVGQLYETVRPYAKKLADERGADVVLRRQDLLLFDYDPSLDITDEIIDALITARAEKPTE